MYRIFHHTLQYFGESSVEQLFAARKDEAVGKWTVAVFAMYPFETSGFLRTQKDQFANPVGHATALAAGRLYDALTGADVQTDAVQDALRDMVRIRAVQDLSPSQAVGALYLLKPVLRELFLTEALATGKLQALLEAESRLDTLALMGFDLYMQDKEAVFATRVGELKRRTVQLERWVAAYSGPPSEKQAAYSGSQPEKQAAHDAPPVDPAQ